MNAHLILGIDIGLTGAKAILDTEKRLIDVFDMPCLGDGPASRRTINGPRIVGIPPGKDGAKDLARSKAIAIWPGEAARFARVRDHGRAEACLIGVAGLLREGRP
jgi:hypothetical protein